jgi:hypothetical protein
MVYVRRRSDKAPEDATTTEALLEMHREQRSAEHVKEATTYSVQA